MTSVIDILFGENRYILLINGLIYTLGITFIALALGILIGIVIALCRLSNDFLKETRFKKFAKYNILFYFSIFFVDFIRGTPVVVQLFLIYSGIFVGVLKSVPILVIAGIAFGINSGAYVSEIIRAGIVGLDKGQNEAARALGLSYGLSIKKIILPQAFKNMLPTLVSEAIALFKETSVAGFIGGQDLMRSGSIIVSKTYNGIVPYIAVALIYLCLTSIFSYFLRRFERRLARDKN